MEPARGHQAAGDGISMKVLRADYPPHKGVFELVA